MTINSKIMSHADIEWQDGLPYSKQFQDIYFSRQDGLEETHYTFIEGNRLKERWSLLNSSDFKILEVGFGTGLNCLSTIEHWQSFNNDSWLHYHSIEKFPLKRDDLLRALSFWPSLKNLMETLIGQYPMPLYGVTKILFPDHRATLYLHFMDVIEACDHLILENQLFNSFYLDGFAPSKNPDTWSEVLFKKIAQLSATDAHFATFSAAGYVRRGLQKYGFKVNKRSGFGTKREMLIGSIKTPKVDCESVSMNTTKPWFQRPESIAKDARIAVIGSGIAGATTALMLANNGYQVEVFESKNEIAAGGSGSASGIFYPFLTKDLNDQSLLFFHAYQKLIHWLDRLELAEFTQNIGVLKLHKDTQFNTQLFNQLGDSNDFDSWLRQWPEASSSGLTYPLLKQGILFPRSGYIDLKRLCEKLLEHPKIKVRLNSRVDRLDDLSHGWKLEVNNDVENFDAVVMCNAYSAHELLPKSFLPGNKVRGQTAKVSIPKDFPKPPYILCESNYCIPMEDSLYVGATFELNNHNENFDTKSHQELVENLNVLFENATFSVEQAEPGRVGFRHCSVDRLPYVGPLPKFEQTLLDYQHLWKGNHRVKHPSAQYWPALYVNIAHGARGITTSFLAAELVLNYINGDSFAVSPSIREQLHPSRPLIRELRKPKNQRLPFFQEIPSMSEHGS